MQKFENTVEIHLKKLGTTIEKASVKDLYTAVATGVIGQIATKWCNPRKSRRAAYLSAEFLVGRSIYANLQNAGLEERFIELMREHGVSPDVFEQIGDAALGNGGLGRLAACYLEAAATCGIQLDGYGIRYRYGLFEQRFENGFQREYADNWLRFTDPWSTRRDNDAVEVKFRGSSVMAVPYDMPVIGYGLKTVNTLRLWQAESGEPFDYDLFNEQKYERAVAKRLKAERISDVLYPNDSTLQGKKLRLKQQYFFASASLQDMLKKCDGKRIDKHFAVQLNDTHPVIAIPELIRLLVGKGYKFDEAFDIARNTFSYTNHTVMPEALEKWDISIISAVIPQMLPVLRRIQKRLVKELSALGVSDFEDFNIIAGDTVHMARLAVFVCRKTNGVAELHTDILKSKLFARWHALYPDRIENITNGITQRRWLKLCNPELSQLIASKIGEDFVTDALHLGRLAEYTEDEAFIRALNEVKAVKKHQLAEVIAQREGKQVNEHAIFDVQIKRIHEYKRQFLNALSLIDTYFRIKEGELADFNPTVYIFGGKAAPGYRRAKAVIKLINEIASFIDADSDVREKMQVVFVTDYNVSYAEKIIPAADISEQISLAGTEASGTGNMKLMLNGALTLGTYDGANIEIVEHAGEENNYIFGLNVSEVISVSGEYDPKKIIANEPRLARALDMLINGQLDDGGTGMFRELYDSIVEGADWHRPDHYMLCADFISYCDARDRANRDFSDAHSFGVKRLFNIANAGCFSADRAVKEYDKLIWRL